MTARILIMLSGLIVAGPGFAGHGFMNSFADAEWFPDPGTTPDQLTYTVDSAQERLELLRSETDDETFDLCLAFSKEKLSELSTVIKRNHGAAAQVALEQYDHYVARALEIVEAGNNSLAFRKRFIDALLENIYLITVDYVDMPLDLRPMMGPFFDSGVALYESQRDKLPKPARDALFFKGEEIRWSIEMTRQADKQKIVN